MRIAFVAPALTWHVWPWVKGMLGRGHEVLLLSTSISGEGAVSNKDHRNVPIVNLAARKLGLGHGLLKVPRDVLATRRMVKSFRPDIVHIVGAVASHIPSLLAGFHPVLLNVLGAEVLWSGRRNLRTWAALVMMGRFADGVIADSRAVLNEFGRITRSQVYSERLYWGVDPARYNSDVDTEPLRRQLELGGGPVVLSPRRLDWYYNQHVILESVPSVLAACPSVRFIFKYGDGDPSSLHAQARKLGVGHAVRFVGFVPEQELPMYYAVATVLVSIPSFDSTPRAIFEGMACGALPVVSALQWVEETELQDRVNCRIVKAEDSVTLSAALIELLTSGSYENAKKHNLRFVRHAADPTRQLDQLEAIYSRLID